MFELLGIIWESKDVDISCMPTVTGVGVADDAMAEKDITGKTMEAYHDVFADIINVLLFNGR